ncbi:MAG: hypothetical protein NTV22_09670 [bacterium]|nr:hypothetical protein [bacterium]
MNSRLVTAAALSVTVATLVYAGSVMDNGTVRVGVNGNGAIGMLQWPLSNPADHISDCSLRLRYSGAVQETFEFPNTDMLYPELLLFTGYGRDYGANFFTVSASFLQTGNSYIDQTIVLIPRVPQAAVNFTYYMDADVQETKSNDFGYFEGAYKMVAETEGSTCIGLVADKDTFPSTSHTVAAPVDVNYQIANPPLNDLETQNALDLAAAVAWAPVGVSANPVTFYTRLIAAADVGSAAVMATIQTSDTSRRAHVVSGDRITVRVARFRNNFKKLDRDTMFFKMDVDLSQYGYAITNLLNTDMSVFVGDYFGVLPTATPFKDKKFTQIYKLDDGVYGRRNLTMTLNVKRHLLRLTFNVTRTGLQGATYITPASPEGGEIYLPVAIILTGSSSADTLKGGRTWIIPKSIPMTYTKKPNAATGKKS